MATLASYDALGQRKNHEWIYCLWHYLLLWVGLRLDFKTRFHLISDVVDVASNTSIDGAVDGVSQPTSQDAEFGSSWVPLVTIRNGRSSSLISTLSRDGIVTSNSFKPVTSCNGSSTLNSSRANFVISGQENLMRTSWRATILAMIRQVRSHLGQLVRGVHSV